MSDVTPVPVEDDPRKPYKALIAAVAAFLAVFVVLVITDDKKLTGEDIAQYLGIALALAGLPGGGAFAIPNPKRPKRSKA